MPWTRLPSTTAQQPGETSKSMHHDCLPTRNVHVLATSAGLEQQATKETPERHSRQSAPYSLGYAPDFLVNVILSERRD
jgi:hypothetical protein